MHRKILFLVFMFLSSQMAMAGWNGGGKIQILYVYPDYVVVIQGPVTGGPAGCAENGVWSFAWADFRPEVQARIMSVLLAAKTSGATIQPVVSDTECGPEGHKKFTGHFQLP